MGTAVRKGGLCCTFLKGASGPSPKKYRLVGAPSAEEEPSGRLITQKSGGEMRGGKWVLKLAKRRRRRDGRSFVQRGSDGCRDDIGERRGSLSLLAALTGAGSVKEA